MQADDGFGTMLRQLRERLTPADAGIPGSSTGVRRTPGLRRDELADAAGVSADHLTRLEQGRRHPSPGVVDALARSLRLTHAEHERLRASAGYAAPRGGTGLVPRRVTSSAARMLDRLTDVPVCVTDATWTVLAGNDRYAAYGCVTPETAGRDRNIAWRAFAAPGPDAGRPPGQLRMFRAAIAADLRTAASRYREDPELHALIADLHRVSPEFGELWRGPVEAELGVDRLWLTHPGERHTRIDRDAFDTSGDLRLHVFTRA